MHLGLFSTPQSPNVSLLNHTVASGCTLDSPKLFAMLPVSLFFTPPHLISRSTFLPLLPLVKASTMSTQATNRPPRNRNNSRNRPSRSRPTRSAPRASIDPFAGPAIIRSPPPQCLPKESVSILWLRNDLRIRDNAALALATTAEVMVPVYVFDESQYGPHNLSPHGFQRTGPFRAKFQVDSVRDVRNSLRMRGSDMVLRQGEPAEELLDITESLVEAGMVKLRVVAHKELTWEEVQEERKVEAKLKKLASERDLDLEMHFVWGSSLHHIDDLPFNAGGWVPRTFTDYRKMIENGEGVKVRPEVKIRERLTPFPLHLKIRQDPLPSLEEDLEVEGLCEPHDYAFPHPLAVHSFGGGETAAVERWDEWAWLADGLKVYKETRNESGVRNCSSKMSPWLALGCVSPRTLYWSCKEYEEKRAKNESTYWMVFELMTRDYFRWVAASVGTRLFALNGYSGKGAEESAVWKVPSRCTDEKHKERFQKWIAGQTGAPFVDANMRELASTGYMSNRGRQNVASFLIHDLKYPDWRAGAEYFESMLIDHDVASNWANWAYIAGVGSDPRGGRRFNVVKQGTQYDPEGFFVTRWCPELTDIPAPMIHEPHTLSELELEDMDVKLGETYPFPIVELLRAPANTSV